MPIRKSYGFRSVILRPKSGGSNFSIRQKIAHAKSIDFEMGSEMAVLREGGWTNKRIAGETGIPLSTVNKLLKNYDRTKGIRSLLVQEGRQDA